MTIVLAPRPINLPLALVIDMSGLMFQKNNCRAGTLKNSGVWQTVGEPPPSQPQPMVNDIWKEKDLGQKQQSHHINHL